MATETPTGRIYRDMVSDGFKMGEPIEAGWYLVATRTNAVEETYCVYFVWFNPSTGTKYYVGGGYSGLGDGVRFEQQDDIVAYKPFKSLYK